MNRISFKVVYKTAACCCCPCWPTPPQRDIFFFLHQNPAPLPWTLPYH